jgi:glycosyltransferase involved in cell wall biosynthesis
MKTPYVSIIIPAYNAWEHLVKLLFSLQKSTFKDFEVIIGDDASNEQLTVNNLQTDKKKLPFSLQVVRLTRNRGPAAARNAAAKRAKGRVLVFLDADVQVYPDTIKKIAEKFKDDDDLTAITGVWDKHQKATSFFPQFKALRDWSYWTNERDRDGYYYLFSTRIAALKRDVFIRLGGFNEAFRQMEDVELTYRIAKRYAIIFAPDVKVHHEFEGFWAIAWKYFWRSYYWTKLYKERRKFDPVATTVWESLAAASGVTAVGMFFLSVYLAIGLVTGIMNANFGIQGTPINLPNFSAFCFLLFVVLLLVHTFLLRKFLRFVYREKGFVFMLKALGTGLVLYCIILMGAMYYSLRHK